MRSISNKCWQRMNTYMVANEVAHHGSTHRETALQTADKYTFINKL